MNWSAIKNIYRYVVIANNTIEYLGDDEYKIINWYKNGQKCWQTTFKNMQLHGKQIGWALDGDKRWEDKYKNGKQI